VYGMLAVGLTLFALRYMIPEDRWSDRLPKISFWSLNAGLAWMCFGSMFPLGVLQLYHSVAYGYYDARSLNYIQSGALPALEWMRLPGDVVFIVGGAVPIVILCWQGLRCVLREKPGVAQEVLFTEITKAAPAMEEAGV